MKKYLMGIVAVSAAIGFTAFSPEFNKVRKGLTTYYSIKTSSTHWRWDPDIPPGYECLFEAGAPTCTVNADSKPEDDSAPDGIHNMICKP